VTGNPRKITLQQWDERFGQMRCNLPSCPDYVGPLSRHVQDGDLRLLRLKFDNSFASFRLWNFLLTEEDRLHQARLDGKKIIGTMKDLGTIPVIAYSLDNIVAFYPDGAWWIPCVMELNAGLLAIADSLGIDESFCPVRAMLGAFVTQEHFPIPDLLICSAGATCDDFSVIAQRLNDMGQPIFWWEIPHRRTPRQDEQAVVLPGGFSAPKDQVEFVKSELERIKSAIEDLSGRKLDDTTLSNGIKKANTVRALLSELRRLTFTARLSPLPALEMLIAEMLAIHFCSDRGESIEVLSRLVEQVQIRIKAGYGFGDKDDARIFWVNPPADLLVMNLLEDCSGRLCGTDFLFSHALDIIPAELPPMEALAQVALADPMAGSAADRADRICRDAVKFGAEAVLVSRIPGASHCALEGLVISEIVGSNLKIPVVEIEVPPLTDSILPTLRTRITALVETVKQRRRK
jgi:hypothetical protein